MLPAQLRITHGTTLRTLRRTHAGPVSLFGLRSVPPPRRAFSGWVFGPLPRPDAHPRRRPTA